MCVCVCVGVCVSLYLCLSVCSNNLYFIGCFPYVCLTAVVELCKFSFFLCV